MPRQQPVQLDMLEGERPVTIDTSTLRPGFLVGLKTSVTGNVSYNKETIEAEHRLRSGALKATWQTERTVAEPEEYKRASQTRMKIRQIICSVCAKSAFGLLCPESQITKLELAVKEARRVADTFNRKAVLTRVTVYVITGKIARDDVEAVRAVNGEVRDLLRSMSEGVKTLDVKAVRDAANRARNIGSMLSPEAASKIKGAIEAARGAARKIVKAGETAAAQIDREAITAISQARTAFLDVEDDVATEMADVEHEARAVDIDPEAVVEMPGEIIVPAKKPRKFSGKKKKATTKKSRTTAEASA